MLEFIKRVIAPPVFLDDEEKTRLARSLNVMMWLFVGSWFAGMFSIPFASPENRLTAVFLILTLLSTGVVGLFAIRRGYVRGMARFFAFSLWASTSVVMVVMGGVESPETGSYILTILFAGLFLGMQAVYVFTGLSIVSILIVFLLDQGGYLPPVALPINTVSGGIIGVLNVAMAAGLVWIVLNNLKEALGSLRTKQSELAASNNELQTLMTSVAAMAESARADADAAQAALQSKLDESNAIAQIDESMRGEQDLFTLAQNILRQLCQSLDAQMGALFVREGEILRMVSSYAYSSRKNVANQFRLGEGLVGQAALEQKPITLTKAPPDYISIASGIIELAPRNIIALPFLHNNQVIGVIELASLTEFTPAQTALLEKALGSIAIGLSTAQARMQINTLLAQTQQQAQELRLREEKLKSINEELQVQTENLRASQSQLRKQQSDLESANAELEERTATLQEQRAVLDQQNRELKAAQQELQRKTEELMQTNKYKSEFLANMSHELRTPLNSLLILGQMLADNSEGNLTNEQVESARIIYNSGSDLLALINEILDLSKVEAGRMTFHIAPMPFANVVEHIQAQFDPVAQQKGVSFDVNLAADLPVQIETDQQRVEQILKNLLSNAFKFTEKGRVALSIERTDDFVALRVTDTGIGMTPDQQQRVFDAFQQADGSTSRKYGGTGLGLTISREMATRLGGRIGLESEYGKGSTFTLYLPLGKNPPDEAVGASPTVQAAPKIAAPASGKESPHVDAPPTGAESTPQSVAPLPFLDDRQQIRKGDKTLLVIEDDPAFARILYDYGHKKEFKCLVALDGESGLALAHQHYPDAILLDLKLPGISGWQVLDDLKQAPDLRHIPVHILSAEEATMDAYQRGALGFLHKPVSPEGLEGVFQKIGDFVSRDIKNLLLIEDDAALRHSVRQLLGGRDVKISEAASGQAAIQLLHTQRFDCMILDLTLPDMTGFDLLNRINRDETVAKCPVIVYTGKALTEEENAELLKYADSVIIKGVKSPERLLDETALFLHRVVADMPEEKQRTIKRLHDRENAFDGKHILVVDDDMRNAFALSRLVSDKGLKVSIARSGAKALEMLDTISGIDLVLMDIMMPEMDGYETMRRIRAQARFQSLPILALTAKAMKGDQEKCIQAGANDYLSKPIEADRLFSMLRVWLYR